MISFLYRLFLKLLHEWRRSLLIFVIAGLWFHMVAGFASNYAYNMTDSVPGKLFEIRPDLPLERDAVVIFPRRDPLFPDGVEHMTKFVRCLPGDMLQKVDRYFVCNGRWIATVKTQSQSGDAMAAFDWKVGPVPEGFFFAATDHPDGYDSRYFGLVPLESATVLERVL